MRSPIEGAKMGNRKDAPYSAWGVEVAEAKADSRLLILDGYRPGGFARHVWSFDGRRFHHAQPRAISRAQSSSTPPRATSTSSKRVGARCAMGLAWARKALPGPGRP